MHAKFGKATHIAIFCATAIVGASSISADSSVGERLGDDSCDRLISLMDRAIAARQNLQESRASFAEFDSRRRGSPEGVVDESIEFIGTVHESCFAKLVDHPAYDLIEPAIGQFRQSASLESTSANSNASDANSAGSRISASAIFRSASYGSVGRDAWVYYDGQCEWNGTRMDLCEAYRLGFESTLKPVRLRLGDTFIEGSICVPIDRFVCPLPPLPPPPQVGCTATLPSVDYAAKTELESYPQEPFERSFALTCTGSSIHVADRNENRPPPRDTDAYKSWDPCEIAIPPTQDAEAYGRSHPYFNNLHRMNAGIGCGNSRRTKKEAIYHTDGSLNRFNRNSWKFSEMDKQWVEAMKKSLYLVGGLRNGVWFYDVEPNGRDSLNGRSVK